MTEDERIKLAIVLHQFTPAERLSAMEIRCVLEFIEQHGFTILSDPSAMTANPGRKLGIPSSRADVPLGVDHQPPTEKENT